MSYTSFIIHKTFLQNLLSLEQHRLKQWNLFYKMFVLTRHTL